MGRIIDRIMRRTVVDLATEVDDSLGRLAHARGQEEAAAEALRLAREDVAAAEEGVRRARNALFDEHPELAPSGWDKEETEVKVDNSGQDNPSAWDDEVVVVDDENDPRFTAGASSVPSSSDSEPLPPITWGERDG